MVRNSVSDARDAEQTVGRESGALSRGARRKTETRQRLLRAAREVFARDGLENATIAQITGAADVGFGTFYLHFATKEEAYRAVVSEGFGELARLLTTARAEVIARDEPWWEAVHVTVRAYCLFAERNRELFRVMFAGGHVGIGIARQLQEQFAAELAEQLTTATADAREHDHPMPYPYPMQPVALVTVVGLTRSMLWWLTQTEQEATHNTTQPLTLDALIDALTRYITAALWGQVPTA